MLKAGDLKPTFELKKINGLQVPFQNGTVYPSFELQRKDRFDLSGEWKYRKFTADHDLSLTDRRSPGKDTLEILEKEINQCHKFEYDDSHWEVCSVPGSVNKMPACEADSGPERYEDGVAYRKRFQIPVSYDRSVYRLVFFSVNYICDVWLNEKWLGYHEGGYTPFVFLLNPEDLRKGDNLLVLRVDNIPWGTRNDIIPSECCEWTNYTGIIHDVYIEKLNFLRIERLDLLPLWDGSGFRAECVIAGLDSRVNPGDIVAGWNVYEAETGKIDASTTISNGHKGESVDFAVQNFQVPETESEGIVVFCSDLLIKNPRLWSPGHPHLYFVELTIIVNGKVEDRRQAQSGIRIVRTDKTGRLLLNDIPIRLFGVLRHEEWPESGRTGAPEQIHHDLRVIQTFNANFIRTGYYPNHPLTYFFTDSLGLAVMEEIPLYKHRSPHFEAQRERRIDIQMWREMIFRDRNRPSVLFWNLGADLGGKRKPYGKKEYLERMISDYRNNYSDKRLLVQAASAGDQGAKDFSQYSCDAAGWSAYFGAKYGISAGRGVRKFLVKAMKYHPDKPHLITAFGFWSSPTTSGKFWLLRNPQKKDYRYKHGTLEETQLALFKDAFNAFKESFREYPLMCGIVWESVFDWYRQQPGIQSMGLLHMDRKTPKKITEPFQTEITKLMKELLND